MSAGRSTLILSDGGLAAAIACASAREEASLAADQAGARVFVAPFGLTPGLEAVQIAAVARQAETYALETPATGACETAIPGGSEGERESLGLVAAAFAAARAGCAEVIWPVTTAVADGIDIDRLAMVTDRALMTARLAALSAHEHGRHDVAIRTPYADLLDEQVAELALDMGVAPQVCWWWGQAGDLVRGEARAVLREERNRWAKALRAMGWVAAGLERAEA